jgi:hypothetical protein
MTQKGGRYVCCASKNSDVAVKLYNDISLCAAPV